MNYTGDYSRRAEVHWIHTFLDPKVIAYLYYLHLDAILRGRGEIT